MKSISRSQKPPRLSLAAIAWVALLFLLPSLSRSQTLTLAEPSVKAHITKVGSIPILYSNSGKLPLRITGVTVLPSGTPLSFDYESEFDSIVGPGSLGFFSIHYASPISYEYNCDVRITSNDPKHPLTITHVRVNDSVPPNPVRNLRVYPMKGGDVRIAWTAPLPARDGDTVWHTEVYTGRTGESYDSLMEVTRDTTLTLHPPGDGILFVSVITWDDMGNSAVATDTSWTSMKAPDISLLHIDPNTTNIPEHIARGAVPLQILVSHPHLSYVRVSARDTLPTAPLQLIGEHTGPIGSADGTLSLNWNTLASTSPQDLVIYARDSIGDETTRSWRFQITQVSGWPRYVAHPNTLPSSTTISDNGTSRFLLTGSDIADGAFTCSGNNFFDWWPLDVTRSTADIVVTSTAEIDDAHTGFEELVGSGDNHALVLSADGRTIKTLGALQPNSEAFTFTFNSKGVPYFLAGPSPVVIQSQTGLQVAGASNMWSFNGDSLGFENTIEESGLFDFDRVVAGSLTRNGLQQFVRVHSAPGDSGEVLAVYDANGAMRSGWPRTLWYPNARYKGFYPSLGDIDGDGKLEIVIPTPNDTLWAFRSDGSVQPGYPIHLNTHDAGRNQALIVDANADGAADIIIPAQDSIICINGLTGQPLRGIWPIHRHAKGSTLLTAVDLDQDGFIDLIESPQVSDTGAWCYVHRLGVVNNPNSIQWGTFQHDMSRSGNFDAGKISLGVATQSESESEEVSIYPQPASTTLHVTVSETIAEQWSSIHFVDILGRSRLQISNAHSLGNNQSLDLRSLPNGTYFLLMTTRDGERCRSVSIVR